METEIAGLVSSVGFPIALSIWFMIRTEKVVQNNTIALTRFLDVTKKCEVKGG